MNTLRMSSGLPEDASVNTIHVLDNDPDPAFADWFIAIEAFYNGLSNYMSAHVATTQHSIKVYSLSDPEPRVPVASTTYAFSGGVGATRMPAEVSLCVSFQAPPESGLDQARRRGRLYFGPICYDAAGSDGRPSPAFKSDLMDALVDMATGIEEAGALFGVYSRANEGMVRATEGWVDDAFDTQRRRGLKATSRVTADWA